ncbi:pectinacetylesterase family protein [Desulfatitalea alkaliphila]|uniref:Pectinacetylesterase family protein n=1 Tax=Desulfatitalea alkaliphila TaxID=2929485 RepID=A0AA41UMS8_9BACT|nr:pectinacetylesterase family protein [Desulfatitalea alkaliphila]MCJ8502966.1 pectinacetylesterase family protein [Desulfatitalea alkaliphila]
MQRHRWSTIFLFTLLCVFFLAGNALAKGPKAKPFIPDLADEWTIVRPAERYPDFQFKGLAPACSNGPDAESDEFFFFVKGGDVNNLVVYFQGGGACWDGLTCLGYKPYTQDCTVDDNPVNYGGMFDFQRPDNPFKEWSFVFIPYCTGDIHWGAQDTDYIFESPFGPLAGTIQHRGFVNFQVVLQYITDTFAKPDKIFVTGSSAGAYGALGGFPWIKEAFPKAHVTLLGDAGMGINPAEYMQLSRANWNTQYPPWLLYGEEDHPTVANFWTRVADAYPRSKIGEFTNAWDEVQIMFYGLIYATMGLEPPFSVPYDWHVRMWQGLDDKAEQGNYRYYVADGVAHTILATDLFYTESSAQGIPFLSWLDAMVKNQGGTNGRGAMPWRNVACEDCRE